MLEAFGAKLRYHIELKDDLEATPARVVEIVVAAGLEQRVMLTSFSRLQLERARRSAPTIPLCWLLESAHRESIDAAAEAGFAMVGVHASGLTEQLVRHAHARGLQIRAFGVETDAEMHRVLGTGCNGMTLDRPERLVSHLIERMLAPSDSLASARCALAAETAALAHARVCWGSLTRPRIRRGDGFRALGRAGSAG